MRERGKEREMSVRREGRKKRRLGRGEAREGHVGGWAGRESGLAVRGGKARGPTLAPGLLASHASGRIDGSDRIGAIGMPPPSVSMPFCFFPGRERERGMERGRKWGFIAGRCKMTKGTQSVFSDFVLLVKTLEM